MSKEKELGTLVIVVLKVSLNGTTKRTQVDAKGGQHPVWDAELRFSVLHSTTEKNRKLEVSCYAKEHKSDDLLGNGIVDITETLKSGEFDDWVPLNVNGVIRGDIYLEMTYFANTPAGPAPVASLAVPAADHTLTRRPSKLSPSDRLYRSPQNLTPLAPTTTSPSAPSKTLQYPGYSSHHVGGESTLRPSSAPPKRSESPLPAPPEGKTTTLPLPEILIPRGGRTHTKPQDSLSPQIPSILRPRNAIPSPMQADQRPGSLPYPGEHYVVPNSPAYEYGASYSRPNHEILPTAAAPRMPYPPSTTPLPYIPIPNSASSEYGLIYPRGNHHDDVPFTNAAPIPYPSSTPQPYTPAPGSITPSEPRISFPVPTIVPLQASTAAPYPVIDSRPFSNRPLQKNDFPDPYLQTRYQTPLPLPPGFTDLKAHSSQTAPGQTQSNIGNSIIDAPRREGDEVRRQKEQEQRDLELALQLDRELNLAS